MKFLKDIEPYKERIFLQVAGKGRMDHQKAKEIDNIFHEFVINSDEKIYPNNKNRNKTDVSCNSCVKSMIQLVANWIRILEEREENKPKKYKAIKERVEVIEPTVDVDRMKEKYNADTSVGKIQIDEDACVKDLEDNEGWATHPEMSEDDKISHLRQALDELGVKYHHKQKAKSLQKLLNKQNG